MDQAQIALWKQSIENYRNEYYGLYAKQPSEKMVIAHCNIYKIPYPLPDAEEGTENIE